MTDLADRWPLAEHADVRDALLAAYADPSRGYHDSLHLTEVLDRLGELSSAGVAFDPTMTALAAWFHDAVYDGERDAEDRSAVWAEEALSGTPYAAEVARLVRLTETHDPGEDDGAGQALCDADLAILASPPERYDAYLAGVRRDYAHISDADFASGRAAVLHDLAGRARLFHTTYGRDTWEPRARANLERELERLAGAVVDGSSR
jgi:predicted metal-dependent HD superfamily phosphohydrolase